jgi:cytochrome c-type biogenesis protein CcmH/NrfF
MFLGLALSNWMIWITMILFILIYFVVTERMNRREEATDEDRSN